MKNDSQVRALLESEDLDTLVLTADEMARDNAWVRLASLREGAIQALDAGHQLWPLAARIDYLFALAGPASLAGSAVSSPYSRFAPGPLTEVAAIAHTWSALASEIEEAHSAAVFAHERVVRGEVLDGGLEGLDHYLDLPGHLLHWEPEYSLAVYEIDDYSFPAPAIETLGPSSSLQLSAPGSMIDSSSSHGAERHVEEALRALTEVWTSQSNGRCEVVVAKSDIEDVLGRLGPRKVALSKITAKQALAEMAWTAASGGAYGRRRGAAAGRVGALWVTSDIAGLDWPPDFSRLGESAAETEWYRWDTGAPDTGWRLQIAFHNQVSGIAGALEASDAA